MPIGVMAAILNVAASGGERELRVAFAAGSRGEWAIALGDPFTLNGLTGHVVEIVHRHNGTEFVIQLPDISMNVGLEGVWIDGVNLFDQKREPVTQEKIDRVFGLSTNQDRRDALKEHAWALYHRMKHAGKPCEEIELWLKKMRLMK